MQSVEEPVTIASEVTEIAPSESVALGDQSLQTVVPVTTDELWQCCSKNCVGNIPFTTRLLIRTQIGNLKQRKRHLLLMGKLFETVGSPDMPMVRAHYSFSPGFPLCIKGFMHVFNVGKDQLYNLRKQMEKNGLSPKVHGLKGKKANNSHAVVVLEKVKSFILAKAELHGLPIPFPTSGCTQLPRIYLPAKDTEAEYVAGLQRQLREPY